MEGMRGVRINQGKPMDREEAQEPGTLQPLHQEEAVEGPPPTPEIMEEACSDESFDLPPPEAPLGRQEEEVSRTAIPEQAGTDATPSAAGRPASTVILPSHPVLAMDEKELQEHRDAILQQQMLGRQLLSEVTRRHNSR